MIPRSWMTAGRCRYSAAVGVVLGMGFVTRVTTGVTYVIALLAAASGRPTVGAVIFCCFGFGRAVPVLAVSRCFRRHGGHPMDCLNWLGWSRPIPAMLARAGVAVLFGVIAGVSVSITMTE